LVDHLIEASRAQTRILLQGPAEEVEIGIGEVTTKEAMTAKAAGVQRDAHE